MKNNLLFYKFRQSLQDRAELFIYQSILVDRIHQINWINPLSIILSIPFVFYFLAPASALEIGPSSVYPVCIKGEIACPDNFLPYCPEDKEKSGTPKCVQIGSMFIPGCWQLVGIKKIDLGFEKMMLSPTTMVKVIGGGETYTLNRETVFCKRIDNKTKF